MRVKTRRRRRTRSAGAEPGRQAAEQVRLVLAGPDHVAVGPQQHGGHVQFVAGIDDVVDTVLPARHGELAGLVDQEPAAFACQLVEPASRQADVAQPASEQLLSFADVVADPDRGDLLDQEAAHVLEVQQLGQQPAYRLGTGSGEISSDWARVLFSTSSATGWRSVW